MGIPISIILVSIPFYDRLSELSFLREVYFSGRAELVVVYGRRRIGKTTLVRKFLEEFPGVYVYVSSSNVQSFW